jgi:hypothetical protein
MTAVEGTIEPKQVDSLVAAYAEIRREPYVFEWPEGKTWTLPHLGELDYRLLAEVENIGDKASDLPYLESLFARMFGPEQAAAWAEVEVPTSVLFMLFERWVQHSGSKPGESPASKRSSKSTGTRSRPTSAASTTSVSPKRSTAGRAPRKAVSPRGNSST